MRKDALLSLIKKYDETRAGMLTQLRKENYRITLLKSFMNTPEILKLSDSENVWFYEFLLYAEDNNKEKVTVTELFSEAYMEGTDKSAALFKEFHEGDEKEIGIFGDLGVLPEEMRDRIVASDSVAKIRFSQTSFTFYKALAEKKRWIKDFTDEGVDPALIKEIADTNLAINWKNLYHAYMRCPQPRPTQLWEMLCLTGNPSAISYVLRLPYFDKTIKGTNNRTVLHYIILSASESATDYALRCGIAESLNEADIFQVSLLAMHTRRISEVDRLWQISKKSATNTGIFERIVAAIESKNIDIIKYFLQISKNTYGSIFYEPIHHAFKDAAREGLIPRMLSSIGKTGNIPLIDYCFDNLLYEYMNDHVLFLARIDLRTQYMTILAGAAKSGSIQAFDHVLAISTRKFGKIEGDAVWFSLLDQAMTSGSIPAFEHVLALSSEKNLTWPTEHFNSMLKAALSSGSMPTLDYAFTFCQERGHNITTSLPNLFLAAIHQQNIPMINYMLEKIAAAQINPREVPEVRSTIIGLANIGFADRNPAMVIYILDNFNKFIDPSSLSAKFIVDMFLAEAARKANGPLVAMIRQKCDEYKLPLTINSLAPEALDDYIKQFTFIPSEPIIKALVTPLSELTIAAPAPAPIVKRL